MALKSKSLSDLVREGLELAESNISWTDLVLLYYFLGDFYWFIVVRGHEQAVVSADTFQDLFQIRIIAFVSVLDSVPYRALKALFLSKGSFFIHVGTSYQLDSEIRSLLLASLYF